MKDQAGHPHNGVNEGVVEERLSYLMGIAELGIDVEAP